MHFHPMTFRLLALAALALAALACNGDDPTPAPTATQTAPHAHPLALRRDATPRITPAPAAKGWRTLAPMPTPRSEVAVAAVGGKIYVVGGFEGDGSTSDAVEVYDPVTDTWTQAPPLPEPRHHTAAMGVGGAFLYVIGGFGTSFSDPQSSVFRFDTTYRDLGGASAAADRPWRSRRHRCRLSGPRRALAFTRSAAAMRDRRTSPRSRSTRTSRTLGRGCRAFPRPATTCAAQSAVRADRQRSTLSAAACNVDFGQNLDANEEYDPGTDTWTAQSTAAHRPQRHRRRLPRRPHLRLRRRRLRGHLRRERSLRSRDRHLGDPRTDAHRPPRPRRRRRRRHHLRHRRRRDPRSLSVSGANEAYTP